MSNAYAKGLFPSALMDEIRSQFLYVDWDPYSGRRTFFEAASGSCRPKGVIEAMAMETCLLDQQGRDNPGSQHAMDVTARGIADLMLFFGARSGHIIPGWSSSHVIYRITDAVLASVPGNNIVTTGLDHASVRSALTQFSAKYGKEERVAAPDHAQGSVPLDSIYELIDEDTCFLMVTHTSNVTGEAYDVAAIVREARRIKPDLFVMVDGVQHYGHATDRLATLPHWKYTFKPAASWDLGGVEHQSYAAWSAVTDYLCWLGGKFTDSADRRAGVVAAMEAIRAHMTGLLDLLLHGNDCVAALRSMEHVTVYGMGDDLARQSLLVGFNLAGIEATDGCARCRANQLRLHAPGHDPFFAAMLKQLGIDSFIRLSGSHYNSPQEIEHFLRVTASLRAAARPG